MIMIGDLRSLGRVVVVVLVVLVAAGFTAAGSAIGTAVLLSAASLGIAAELALRLVPSGEAA